MTVREGRIFRHGIHFSISLGRWDVSVSATANLVGARLRPGVLSLQRELTVSVWDRSREPERYMGEREGCGTGTP